MNELVLSLHGLGDPHPAVGAEEQRYWWREASFAALLDEMLSLPMDSLRRVQITFDDGNTSDVLLALPTLANRALTASFFVCAGRIGKKYYLDRPMIEELLAAGMRIGSHGMDHRDWRKLDTRDLDVEVTDARRKLEDITQRPVSTVAIPFGSYDRRVLSRLEREPWDVIYTSDGGMARSTSRLKAREGLVADFQGAGVLGKLLERPSAFIRTRRILSRVYKRIR